jgi:hypothetical protein
MKTLFLAALLCLAARPALAVDGKTFILTGTYKPASMGCDDAGLALSKAYSTSMPDPAPFFFSFDTVCIGTEAGNFLEVQMIAEPRNESEIPALEKWVEKNRDQTIDGMKFHLQPMREINSDLRFQWVNKKDDENEEVFAELQTQRIHASYLAATAEMKKRQSLVEKATWDEFYAYAKPLLGEDMIGMTRYYSAHRSNFVNLIEEHFLVGADDGSVFEEFAVPNAYRDCKDFGTDGKCQ